MPADGESLEVEAAEIAKLEGLAAGEEYRVTLTDGARHEVTSVRRVVSGGPLVVVRGAWNPITGEAVRAFESINFM